jgi:hypothetical protein
MRRLLATGALSLLAACGGLENVPLTLGAVRGALQAPNGDAQVAVVNHPELSARPAMDGTFTLADVPQGEVELLLLVTDKLAERRRVTVTGGAVTDVGVVVGKPALDFEVELYLPDLLSPRAGVVTIVGTALSEPVEASGDPWGGAKFALPEGCYRARGDVPGLKPVEGEACVSEAAGPAELHLVFATPSGEPGEEGCALSGCLPGTVCRSDGRCEAP